VPVTARASTLTLTKRRSSAATLCRQASIEAANTIARIFAFMNGLRAESDA
jgi:hypothetical protein